MTEVDVETWESPSGRVLSGESLQLTPVLTVLWHPDVSRVGDRAALPLVDGASLEISRTTPELVDPRTGARRSLGDPHLSRRPLVVRRAGGWLEIDAGRWPTRLEVDGEEVADRHRVELSALRHGLVLVLARAVTVLLHWSTQAIESSDERPRTETRHGLVGLSPAMQAVGRDVEAVGKSDLSVLVRGASGTGKELVARAIHAESPRRDGPFVAVDLGALPPNLAAAELFGVERGAFTGADRARTGRFVEARGGTLFLDEVGEASPEVQTALLRALESRRIRAVGGTREIPIDVRIVSATDRDLPREVEAGGFREALLHRLAGYVLEVPSLADRREDIGRLLVHFLEREDCLPGPGEDATEVVPARLVAAFARHPWPGNVRQLANAAAQLCVAWRARRADLPPAIRALARDVETLDVSTRDLEPAPRDLEPVSRETVASAPRRSPLRSIADLEDDEIVAALEQQAWRAKPAAEALGVSRASLYRRLEKMPSIVRASDLDRAEIEAALARHAGDFDAAAAELRVSREALWLRMHTLGL